MKVCLITNNYPPFFVGGDAKAVEYTLKCLKDERYCVIVADAVNFSNKRIYSIGSKNKFRFLASRFLARVFDFDPIAYLKIKKVLEREKPDIVHVHNSSYIGITPYILTKKMRIPTVHTAHDAWLACALRHPKENKASCKPSLLKCFFCTIHHGLLPVVRVESIRRLFLGEITVIAPSKYLRTVFKTKGYSAKIIRNAVILSKNRKKVPTPKGGKMKLLYIGRLDMRKRIMDVLEIVREIPNVTLTIVGKGPLVQEVEEYVKQHNLGGRVIHYTRVSDEELSYLYHWADGVILLSEWENAPLVLIEGLAAGCFLIGRNIPGINEIVTKEVGYLVKDNEEAKKVLTLLLKNRKLIKKLKKNAKQEYEQKYSLQAYCKQIKGLYLQLISQNPQPHI